MEGQDTSCFSNINRGKHGMNSEFCSAYLDLSLMRVWMLLLSTQP